MLFWKCADPFRYNHSLFGLLWKWPCPVWLQQAYISVWVGPFWTCGSAVFMDPLLCSCVVRKYGSGSGTGTPDWFVTLGERACGSTPAKSLPFRFIGLLWEWPCIAAEGPFWTCRSAHCCVVWKCCSGTGTPDWLVTPGAECGAQHLTADPGLCTAAEWISIQIQNNRQESEHKPTIIQVQSQWCGLRPVSSLFSQNSCIFGKEQGIFDLRQGGHPPPWIRK